MLCATQALIQIERNMLVQLEDQLRRSNGADARIYQEVNGCRTRVSQLEQLYRSGNTQIDTDKIYGGFTPPYVTMGVQNMYQQPMMNMQPGMPQYGSGMQQNGYGFMPQAGMYNSNWGPNRPNYQQGFYGRPINPVAQPTYVNNGMSYANSFPTMQDNTVGNQTARYLRGSQAQQPMFNQPMNQQVTQPVQQPVSQPVVKDAVTEQYYANVPKPNVARKREELLADGITFQQGCYSGIERREVKLEVGDYWPVDKKPKSTGLVGVDLQAAIKSYKPFSTDFLSETKAVLSKDELSVLTMDMANAKDKLKVDNLEAKDIVDILAHISNKDVREAIDGYVTGYLNDLFKFVGKDVEIDSFISDTHELIEYLIDSNDLSIYKCLEHVVNVVSRSLNEFIAITINKGEDEVDLKDVNDKLMKDLDDTAVVNIRRSIPLLYVNGIEDITKALVAKGGALIITKDGYPSVYTRLNEALGKIPPKLGYMFIYNGTDLIKMGRHSVDKTKLVLLTADKEEYKYA